MRRNRGAAIIIQGGKIALIKRVREGELYFVFPGGELKKEKRLKKQRSERFMKN